MGRRATFRPRRLNRDLRVTPRTFRGKLAEDYDGIGQYVSVMLSQNSTAVAKRVRVSPGDFGGGRKIPAGWTVNVFSYRGQLEVLLGNQPFQESTTPE